ncbi:hypothetical protein ACI6Q2_18875 [Chitinophagaceae bacterium LWZ2-11]
MSAKTIAKDRYFTKDHEWIDFQGSVAYVGIGNFKLTGFKQIQQINFNDPFGFKSRGEIIATVKYNDYLIEVQMPVNGKIVELNKDLLSDNLNVLLQHAEDNCWIARIIPSEPYERKGLIPPKDYRMNRKSK